MTVNGNGGDQSHTTGRKVIPPANPVLPKKLWSDVLPHAV